MSIFIIVTDSLIQRNHVPIYYKYIELTDKRVNMTQDELKNDIQHIIADDMIKLSNIYGANKINYWIVTNENSTYNVKTLYENIINSFNDLLINPHTVPFEYIDIDNFNIIKYNQIKLIEIIKNKAALQHLNLDGLHVYPNDKEKVIKPRKSRTKRNSNKTNDETEQHDNNSGDNTTNSIKLNKSPKQSNRRKGSQKDAIRSSPTRTKDNVSTNDAQISDLEINISDDNYHNNNSKETKQLTNADDTVSEHDDNNRNVKNVKTEKTKSPIITTIEDINNPINKNSTQKRKNKTTLNNMSKKHESPCVSHNSDSSESDDSEIENIDNKKINNKISNRSDKSDREANNITNAIIVQEEIIEHRSMKTAEQEKQHPVKKNKRDTKNKDIDIDSETSKEFESTPKQRAKNAAKVKNSKNKVRNELKNIESDSDSSGNESY